jgi:two-component system CheB/CheR fusion protein
VANDTQHLRGEAPLPMVVLVGSSAGGLDPLKAFVSALPAGAGLAVVVLQHAQADKETLLPEILGRLTRLRVIASTHEEPLTANVVSVIPPGSKATIAHDAIVLEDRRGASGAPHLIDALFTSAAEALGPRAACVVLSGSGSDGTRGARAIRQHGGMVLVQDPQEAAFDSMPRSALSSGLVDHVVAAHLMPGLVAERARLLAAGVHLPDDDADIRRVLDMLYEQTGNDFREYRSGTVRRRLSRRMAMCRAETLEAYLELLGNRPGEFEELTKDLLIGVTGFFRDPEAFEKLATACIRPLVAARDSRSQLRAWVPGCSTGEEAYSVAMLLLEEAGRTGTKRNATVFASDLDEDALAEARLGTYSAEAMAAVSGERLARFFEKVGESWRVGEELRRSLVFSCHNLIGDPPFSKLDMISCRNLLIYFEPDLQKKALSIFGFALNRGGYLFLGKSDADAAQSGWFDTVDGRLRIYTRNDIRARAQEASFARYNRHAIAGAPSARDRADAQGMDKLARAVLLDHFNAALVIVDHGGGIRYFYGSTGRFLDIPSGAPDLNVFAMLRETVSARLRAALQQAIRDKRRVTLQNVEMDGTDGRVVARITAAPIAEEGDHGPVAVVFEEVAAPADRQAAKRGGTRDDDRIIVNLERELRETRDGLQATIQGYEQTTEELNAAHEEVVSMNEELQSTNEELETSKEEIQSANEELNTINAELRERVSELGEANNDLSNLIGATSIATLFLDEDLCIKRFTPPAAKLLNLMPGDQGRPIHHFSHAFDGRTLADDARAVLETLSPVGREVRVRDGMWHTLHVTPYRTLSDAVEGIVITFTDVTRLKRAEEDAQTARVYAEKVIDANREPLVVLDASRRTVSANCAFADLFGVQRDSMAGGLLDEIAEGTLDVPEFHALVARVVQGSNASESCELTIERPGLGARTYRAHANAIPGAGDAGTLVLVALRDITENKRTTDTLRKTERDLRESQKLEGLGRLAGGLAHDFRNMMQITLGYARRLLKRVSLPSDREDIDEIIRASERATALTTQLLAFSRRQELRLVALDLGEVIAEMVHMLEQTIGEDVHLQIELDDSLPATTADRAQLELVIVNIVMNARDAMPRGGELRIRTRSTEVGDVHATQLQVYPGRYVVLEVSDAGIGMDDETQQSIFEPFFTTKGPGAGTGLGLAVAYGVVRQCSGGIEVDSAHGEGSTFRLYLPATAGAVPQRRHRPARAPALPGGSESVLLVEDENGVRNLAALELRELGYTVIEASTGEEALQAASSIEQSIDLLVTDIVLPGMDGRSVYDAISKARPGIRVLFITAYAETHVLRGRINREGTPVLEKPFTADQLAAAMRTALDS